MKKIRRFRIREKHVMNSLIAWFKVTYDRGRRNWIEIDSTKTEAYQIGKLTINEFIWWFHQSRMPNLLLIFVTNICYDFCFNWEKNQFWTNKKFVFFFNCSNWEIFVEKISETNWWKHLMLKHMLLHYFDLLPLLQIRFGNNDESTYDT